MPNTVVDGLRVCGSMGPLIRNGNNFSYNFELEEEENRKGSARCIVYFETTTLF